MPILVDPSLTSTATESTGQVAAPTYASDMWTWTSPSGRVRNLSRDHPYLRPGGIYGHMAAPVALLDSRPPTIDGGVYRGRRVDPRDVQLLLMAHTREPSTWRGTYGQMVADFDTSDAVGLLTVHHEDGTTRSLQCRYVNGLGSPVEGEPGVVKIGTFLVELRAYDPWWYGPVQTRSFTQAAETDFLPGPPFTIMPTELLGSGTVVANPGDVAAYPVWTLTGPMTQASLTAEDGSTFTITYSLDAGESLVVDTDPRTSAFAKITDASGNNLWGLATADYPNLWALPAGESTVTVATSGTSTASSVLLQFNPRYYTA